MLMSAARFGLVVGALLAAVPALAQEAGPAAGPPRLLKGSAIKPAVAEPADLERAAPGFQVAAGEDLWLIDAEAGELIACRLLNTSTVGERVIRCFADRLPRRLRN
ncbi:MAG TPA: hypothetical protein VFZ01_03990 [Geminicoccaceae bacterium]